MAVAQTAGRPRRAGTGAVGAISDSQSRAAAGTPVARRVDHNLRHGTWARGWAATDELLAPASEEERAEVLRWLSLAARHVARPDRELLYRPPDERMC